MQTKLGSLIESWANIAIGFAINYGANVALLPILWDESSPWESAGHLGIAFTIISQIRSYCLRRAFNRIKAKWNTGERNE